MRYICGQCNKEFTGNNILKDHIQSVHEGIRYDCTECETKFYSLQTLRIYGRLI